ncbi:MAG: hypothetical protein LBR07_02950 [Puniceicoccales bacterium]|jgi:hypothetical protein|nr:hypothetical protein [Puniceicoccales bacterium]
MPTMPLPSLSKNSAALSRGVATTTAGARTANAPTGNARIAAGSARTVAGNARRRSIGGAARATAGGGVGRAVRAFAALVLVAIGAVVSDSASNAPTTPTPATPAVPSAAAPAVPFVSVASAQIPTPPPPPPNAPVPVRPEISHVFANKVLAYGNTPQIRKRYQIAFYRNGTYKQLYDGKLLTGDWKPVDVNTVDCDGKYTFAFAVVNGRETITQTINGRKYPWVYVGIAEPPPKPNPNPSKTTKKPVADDELQKKLAKLAPAEAFKELEKAYDDAFAVAIDEQNAKDMKRLEEIIKRNLNSKAAVAAEAIQRKQDIRDNTPLYADPYKKTGDFAEFWTMKVARDAVLEKEAARLAPHFRRYYEQLRPRIALTGDKNLTQTITIRLKYLHLIREPWRLGQWRKPKDNFMFVFGKHGTNRQVYHGSAPKGEYLVRYQNDDIQIGFWFYYAGDLHHWAILSTDGRLITSDSMRLLRR